MLSYKKIKLAEDYTVKITTCNVPTNLASSSITADAATISWKAAAGAKKYKLQYRAGTNPWTSVTNISDTFYNLTGLAVHTAYSYKVQSLCGAGLKARSAVLHPLLQHLPIVQWKL